MHTLSYLLKCAIFHFLNLTCLSPDPLACSSLPRPPRRDLRCQRSHRPPQHSRQLNAQRQCRGSVSSCANVSASSPCFSRFSPLLSGRPLCSWQPLAVTKIFQRRRLSIGASPFRLIDSGTQLFNIVLHSQVNGRP